MKHLNTNITFCIVDDIDTYSNNEIKNITKNICDFTISNLYVKGYKVIIGNDENKLLQTVETDHAVIMSPGTEYINGFKFFEALDDLLTRDFFIAGHVLDRSMHDAYYELHHQCYVINMKYYNALECPAVGMLEKNVKHDQIEPIRTSSTWHDDYTPNHVMRGEKIRTYNNRCHGWNFLRLAFENDLPVIVFNENIRNNKKHYYPESKQDFYKQKEYIDFKLKYCEEELVHTNNTEWSSGINTTYEQLLLPASGTLYLDLIDIGRIVFYDYNQKALDYWKNNMPRKNKIEYVFVHTNLLEELSIVNYLDSNLKTLANLSNIFCYEGTAAKYSLKHRMLAEENLVHALKRSIKQIDINFTLRAAMGH
jgi:hypothetical protein